jgi:hypothetical protein
MLAASSACAVTLSFRVSSLHTSNIDCTNYI